MADSDTLLANIIPRLTGGLENAAVKCLGYILGESSPPDKSSTTRSALSNLVLKGGASLPPIARVQTEVTIQVGEEVIRPDLVGFDDAGNNRLVIEAKFWAGLTGDQVNRYLRGLPTDGTAALLFLAPEARIETLWPELRHRVESDNKGLQLQNDVSGMRGGAIIDAQGNATNQHLMLVSWRHLLRDLKDAAERAMEISIVEDIRQLSGFTELMDSQAFLPFQEADFSPVFARRLIDLRRVYDSLLIEWSGKDWVQDAHRGGADHTGYGRYLFLAGHRAWFGFYLEPWSRGEADTPFWIQLYGLNQPTVDQVVVELQTQVTGGKFLPIYVKPGVGQTEVVNDMLAQFKAIADAIQKFTAAESP